jgi:hypothetical protein
MMDIIEIPTDGRDLAVANSTAPRAGNVLSTQLGSLEYAPDFGVNKRFFLESPFFFQTESYVAHVIERLTQAQINVADLVEATEALKANLNLSVEESGTTDGGLIR